jgi:phosphoribosylanthranilate isomerase
VKPSRTRIKICGVGDVETSHVAAEAGADAIGLMFVEKSPRCVTGRQAREIVKALPPRVTPIGIFQDQDNGQVSNYSERVGFNDVQLHGKENLEFVASLAGMNIIKAVSFDASDIERRLEYWDDDTVTLSAIMVDAPAKGDLAGGTGHALDWSALTSLRMPMDLPLFLAGGLTPDNVGEAIRTVRPWAVDVSSGVESSRGVKDHELIRAFCAAVREADADADAGAG